jgi:hypothetical protein
MEDFMIRNQSSISGMAWKCQDDKWRIRLTSFAVGHGFSYPLSPDGFDTQEKAETWWRATGDPVRCRVCSTQFFFARMDAEFCTPKCRAKYNRHQQGASEHQFTGAYYQRPDEDRSHTRQKETFEYTCEFCGKTNTARAEAKRSGKRVPKYCNDNGGRCRQAANRRNKKNEKSDQWEHTWNANQNAHSGPRTHAAPPPRAEQPESGAPTHTGQWRGRIDAIAYLAAAYRYNHNGTQSAWAKANNHKDALAWAKRYLSARHPDRTGNPADTLYKTMSDCYSYLRKKPE